MAFRKVLFLALAIASASAAPQNVVLRAVPFGSVPVGAVPLTHHVGLGGTHHIVQQPALLPAVRTVAVAPVARTPVVVQETEIVDIDPSYRFGYSVTDTKTGDSKTREETRDGNSVTGSYTVADPDGRLRRVTYTADAENGFQAVVTYDGEAGPPAIPIAGPAVAVAAPTPIVEDASAANPTVVEVRQPDVVRTVPANNFVQTVQANNFGAQNFLRTVPAGNLVSHGFHANPRVVTHNANHVVHTAAVPHHNVVHHQQVAAPTATFLRNADGTFSQVNLNQFQQFQGVQNIPLNSGLLRAFPNLNIAGQHLIHVQ